jgi:ssDNA-binding Zn-finger/Zn-ribbon topoisomerase 1
MFCPKCNKTIPDEKVEEINKRLVDQFRSDCPVCGTIMLNGKERRK